MLFFWSLEESGVRYLTKNWTRADGGIFVDDEPVSVGGGAEIVPAFNEAWSIWEDKPGGGSSECCSEPNGAQEC